jgi:hypothetical protein
LTVFVLGFIADPIINLYLDPIESLIGSEIWEETHVLDVPDLGEESTWLEHFLKGFASLGVLSVIKAFLALSPWRWYLRGSGLISGGRNTGRQRVASISWLVILFGVVTFLVVSIFLDTFKFTVINCSFFTGCLQRCPSIGPQDTTESWRAGP